MAGGQQSPHYIAITAQNLFPFKIQLESQSLFLGFFKSKTWQGSDLSFFNNFKTYECYPCCIAKECAQALVCVCEWFHCSLLFRSQADLLFRSWFLKHYLSQDITEMPNGLNCCNTTLVFSSFWGPLPYTHFEQNTNVITVCHGLFTRLSKSSLDSFSTIMALLSGSFSPN